MTTSQWSPKRADKCARPVGRPARVDVHAILNAALEIGLDQVTMKAVADRLDVGISTLYQYVKNRSDLVRMAALRQAMARRPPLNAGQHWAELVVQYAEDLLSMLVAEPRLIVELMSGGLGPEVEADIVEHFLAAMQAHGFSAEEGVRLYYSLGMVTIGGAVAVSNINASQAAGGSHGNEAKRLLAERGPDDLPLLRNAGDEYQRDDINIWRTALHELLVGVAASRGEVLPPSIAAQRRVSPARPKADTHAPEFSESIQSATSDLAISQRRKLK